jgi:tetratricopeptide (TPR) repeat protein
MKKSLLIFCPVFMGSISLLFVQKERSNSVAIAEQRSAAIACAPAANDITANDEGKFIRLMPGWGTHSYSVSTKSDSAQIYFNQGLSMYYSYHTREAIASFKEAARFDSSCAMIYWGQALAMGPTYNYGYAYKMNANIPSVLEAMNRYAENASLKEKDLIAVMNKRYDVSDASDKERKSLNTAYVMAMKPLVDKYPDDLDIKALYTDAVMLTHSWDFWFNNGAPKAWTPELVQYCKDILQQDPHHPAALHYYIHVTEASRKPEVALSSADSLIKLFPGVAHMVHMSSHEYERIGYYAKGVDANEKADVSLLVYDSLAKGLFQQVHVPHYYAVDAYCAMSGGNYQKGIAKSLTLRNSVSPTKETTYPQYQFMFPQLALVRMGHWNDLLQDTTRINPEWTYAIVLNDFAKGLAYAKTGNLQKAEALLKTLRATKEDKVLKEKFSPHASSPYECAAVAENILLANIRFQQKKYGEAITAIKQAIRAEDSLLYAEPKVWILPARQYLGAFLLQLNKAKEAEQVYRDDLAWNPGNGWSLLGLHQALEAQGKKTELKDLKQRYMQSFSLAEGMPVRSAY